MNNTKQSLNLENINFAYPGLWVSIKWYRITDIITVLYLNQGHVIDLPFELV